MLFASKQLINFHSPTSSQMKAHFISLALSNESPYGAHEGPDYDFNLDHHHLHNRLYLGTS